MPNRAVHDFLTVASSVIITPITYSILSSTPEARDWATVVAALVFVSHNVSGILFSPDLDMDTHIHKRWGLFYVLWVPYQMVIPHRHFWSHGLVVFLLDVFVGALCGRVHRSVLRYTGP
jgi:uncharacterized metal-binding protein